MAELYRFEKKGEGAPPRGAFTGGHIGSKIAYVYCMACGCEWVYNANGIPPSMDNCGHDVDAFVIINFVAKDYGHWEREESNR